MIGAGNVGMALGGAFAKQGHHVAFGVPNPADKKYAALKPVAPAEAAAHAEVIVLATPWPATKDAVAGLGDLSAKIVIDCTNPIGMSDGALTLAIGHDTSAGEQVAQWARGASVFKAFNTIGAANMGDLSGFPVQPVMFVAGDDAAQKPIVMKLAEEIGFAPVDAGPLRIARLLEPLAMLWIDQALYRGAGQDFAFAIVRKR